jgi:hypothetical protein
MMKPTTKPMTTDDEANIRQRLADPNRTAMIPADWGDAMLASLDAAREREKAAVERIAGLQSEGVDLLDKLAEAQVDRDRLAGELEKADARGCETHRRLMDANARLGEALSREKRLREACEAFMRCGFFESGNGNDVIYASADHEALIATMRAALSTPAAPEGEPR